MLCSRNSGVTHGPQSIAPWPSQPRHSCCNHDLCGTLHCDLYSPTKGSALVAGFRQKGTPLQPWHSLSGSLCEALKPAEVQVRDTQ